MTPEPGPGWLSTEQAIEAVVDLGQRVGLPFIAAQSDLGDPDPMCNEAGRPYAETRFRWVDEDNRYWRNRREALDSPFLNAARLMAEPFYYADGRLVSWRPTRLLENVDCSMVGAASSLSAAVIAPVHLPRGLVGAVIWAAREPVAVSDLFDRHAPALQAAALMLVASHAEVTGRLRRVTTPVRLTRREVQCLRWAAYGKTDAEVAIILSLSTSTVRFHIRNAAAKLGVVGRAQAVQAATGLGYVGSR